MLRTIIIDDLSQGYGDCLYRWLSSVSQCSRHSHSDASQFTADIIFVLDGVWEQVQRNLGADITIVFNADDTPKTLSIDLHTHKRDRLFYGKIIRRGQYTDSGIRVINMPCPLFCDMEKTLTTWSMFRGTAKSIDVGFRGTPTYLASENKFFEEELFSATATRSQAYDKKGKRWLYNQRIDWLMQLRPSAVRYRGGLCEGRSEYLKFANLEPLFGDLRILEGRRMLGLLGHKRMARHRYLRELARMHTSLCPAGHGLWTYRLYESMYYGCVIVCPDFEYYDQTMLIMPKYALRVRHDQPIMDVLNQIDANPAQHLEKAHVNCSVFENMGSHELWRIFEDQLSSQ